MPERATFAISVTTPTAPITGTIVTVRLVPVPLLLPPTLNAGAAMPMPLAQLLDGVPVQLNAVARVRDAEADPEIEDFGDRRVEACASCRRASRNDDDVV